MRRPAAVLILVLWALAILSLLAGGLSFVTGQDRILGMYERDRIVAHWLARAGIEHGIAQVLDDDYRIDTDAELWAKDETLKSAPLGGGQYTVMRDSYDDSNCGQYGGTDEAGRLNVNAATRDQLMKLPNMTAPVAAAILDWRDQDEQPQPDGIERGHYTSQVHPYTIRNGPLRTTRELLLVRGVTPELFYNEDTNGNGQLDQNENDGELNQPIDNRDGRLDRGWYAYLTVFSYERNQDANGKKRLNINTANAQTMERQLQLEDWAAQSIVKQRDQRKFEHLVDLLDVQLDRSVNRGSSDNDINSRSDSERNKPVTTDIFKRIVDEITLQDAEVLPGRVNLNTAPRAVLRTILADEVADAVVQQRQGGSYFSSIAELLDVSGMNKQKFGEVGSSITVRSSVFRVYGIGQASSGVVATIECVVDRSGELPRVLYWLESSP